MVAAVAALPIYFELAVQRNAAKNSDMRDSGLGVSWGEVHKIADSLTAKGYDGSRFLELSRVQSKLGLHQPFSDADWSVIDRAMHDPKPFWRSNSLFLLGKLNGTPYQKKVWSNLDEMIGDKTPGITGSVLAAMWGTKDPQLEQYLKKYEAALPDDVAFLRNKQRQDRQKGLGFNP